MKKLIFSTIFAVSVLVVMAQVPNGISHQAVIRNATDQLVTNQMIGIRITILKGSATGTPVYRETYNPKKQTNANGLVSFVIGSGVADIGPFSSINWADGTYFIKTEADPTGGTSYTITGTTQMLAVPYAFYSSSSGSAVPSGAAGGDLTGTYPNPVIGLNKVTNDKIAENAVTTLKIADGTIATSDLADQTVSTSKLGNLAVSTDKIQNGAVTAPKLSSMSAASGQVLTWNGTAWAPATPVTGGLTLPYSGTVTLNPGDVAFKINSSGSLGMHVQGTQGSLYASYAGAGYHAAVAGFSTTEGGYAYGVLGRSFSRVGSAVYAQNQYESNDYYGEEARGLFAEVASRRGRAIYALALATTETNYGVFSEVTSTSGVGVYAYAKAATGNTFGVRSLVNSSNGYSGYFEGGRFYIAGNTGMGTNVPGSHRLRVTSSQSGATGSTGYFENLSGSGIAIQAQTSSSDGTILAVQNGTGYTLRCDGYDPSWFVAMIVKGRKVGINTDNPGDYNLAVNGTAAKTGGGSWSSMSDARLKTVHGAYSRGLSDIVALQPVRFNYIPDNPRQYDAETEQIGFVAQEVMKIFPEAVNTCEDGYLDFNMHAVNVAMVNAIRELKAENDLLKNELNRLKAENAGMHLKDEQLYLRMEKLEQLISVAAEIRQ